MQSQGEIMVKNRKYTNMKSHNKKKLQPNANIMKGQETHFLDFFARGRSDFGGLPRFFFGGSG